jgi:hypothetical protein
MAVGTIGSRVVADVKCDVCGHISGQIFGHRHKPFLVSNFVPRQGYTGPQVKPGMKLRCERCHGPVFLEDATNGLPIERRSRPKTEAAGVRKTAAA